MVSGLGSSHSVSTLDLLADQAILELDHLLGDSVHLFPRVLHIIETSRDFRLLNDIILNNITFICSVISTT